MVCRRVAVANKAVDVASEFDAIGPPADKVVNRHISIGARLIDQLLNLSDQLQEIFVDASAPTHFMPLQFRVTS
jgi:hypothetical protein